MMKKTVSSLGALVIVLLISGSFPVVAQEPPPPPQENFYTKSLHYTNRGIEYLYAKEQGGLERIVGMTATELGCLKAKCHVLTCDECHKKDVGGKAVYSVEPACAESACPRCHGEIKKDDPDVHFKSGMKCMSCHTARELHGDGIAHNTYMEPGFFDTRCENCHETITQTASHTVHGGKLDCSACHTLEFINCFNCHIGARLKEKKDVQIENKDLLFLVNHDGKVTTANFLSYVYQNKTMITLAPYFSHSITMNGRTCTDCHNTAIVRDLSKDRLRLAQWKNGTLATVKGVVPVLEGMKWNLVFLDRQDTTWIPLKNPEPPLLNYSGFCTPLTREQFAKLEKSQGKK